MNGRRRRSRRRSRAGERERRARAQASAPWSEGPRSSACGRAHARTKGRHLLHRPEQDEALVRPPARTCRDEQVDVGLCRRAQLGRLDGAAVGRRPDRVGQVERVLWAERVEEGRLAHDLVERASGVLPSAPQARGWEGSRRDEGERRRGGRTLESEKERSASVSRAPGAAKSSVAIRCAGGGGEVVQGQPRARRGASWKGRTDELRVWGALAGRAGRVGADGQPGARPSLVVQPAQSERDDSQPVKA